MVREQIEVLAEIFRSPPSKPDCSVRREIISAVAHAIRGTAETSMPRIPLVIDPVIVATSGDPLLDADAIESYTKELFPLATLITPNLDEAAQFLGEKNPDGDRWKQPAC